jgi:hypothetical protein
MLPRFGAMLVALSFSLVGHTLGSRAPFYRC